MLAALAGYYQDLGLLSLYEGFVNHLFENIRTKG